MFANAQQIAYDINTLVNECNVIVTLLAIFINGVVIFNSEGHSSSFIGA